MRLSITKSKNATSLYVIKSTYENGSRSTVVVEMESPVKSCTKKCATAIQNGYHTGGARFAHRYVIWVPSCEPVVYIRKAVRR